MFNEKNMILRKKFPQNFNSDESLFIGLLIMNHELKKNLFLSIESIKLLTFGSFSKDVV